MLLLVPGETVAVQATSLAVDPIYKKKQKQNK